jgi:hemoglobin-like flavoprotein
MTKTQIQLVQESFSRLIPNGDDALEIFFSEIFYQRLFEANPNFKLMFTTDLAVQGQKLLGMLRMVVTNLEQPAAFLQEAKDLGVKHLEYSVKNVDYNAVGTAMIWTLEATLGEDFTADVREAWVLAYTLLAQTMTKAASAHN